MTSVSLLILENRGGADKSGVSISQLARLATLLALHPRDLWPVREATAGPDRDRSPGGTGDQRPSDEDPSDTAAIAADARALGALLHHEGRRLVLSAVARALGWDTRRAAAAVAELDRAAIATGARVVRHNGFVGFRPVFDRDHTAVVAAVERYADHGTGMDTTEATLAYAALVRERRQSGSGVRLAGTDDGSRWRLAPLLRKGVLDTLADGSYRPSHELLDAADGNRE